MNEKASLALRRIQTFVNQWTKLPTRTPGTVGENQPSSNKRWTFLGKDEDDLGLGHTLTGLRKPNSNMTSLAWNPQEKELEDKNTRLRDTRLRDSRDRHHVFKRG